LENAEKICGVSLKEQDSKDNTESPVLYTAVKIDDIPQYHQHALHYLSQ
jgi:hypothetical protein